ncbi:DUF1236 domain-containing protein [Bradyrhizobium valentinum]|uniref:DUF1236 domain-containing protein n=1 Tax=Bradyrhizobium valentinum TaxID=1518501 RepID=UPI0007C734D5|nr:DUF1236 domain-containing protein [Bradyrhizobium valentinum]
MTKRFLISVAAATLIAGTGFANAQGTGTGRESPSGGAATQQGGATEQKSDMKSEQKSMGAEKSQRTEDQMKGGKDMKAEGREDKGMKAEGKEDRGGMKAEQKGDREKTTGQGTTQRDQDRDQSTTQQRDQSTTQGREQTTPQKDQKAQGKEDRMQTQTQGGAAGQETSTTGQAGAAGKLSTEQRTQITSAIKETRVQPVTNVNFSISVGTKVPRDVTFHTLPERVVTVYPEWRRYKYILVKEQIVIVDPNTYEIVAVLEA